MAVLPGFVGPAYESRSPNAAAEKLVNLFPEAVESHSSADSIAWALYSLPGLRRFSLLPPPGLVRGLYATSRGRAFAVVNERLYELFQGGTFLDRGTLTVRPENQPSSQRGHVSFADNGVELVIVDGQPMGGWSLRLADNYWRQIEGEGFVGAKRVHFFDGFFVFDNIQSQSVGQVYISGLYDSQTEDPLDFATAEASPDPITSHLVHRREWWIAGSRSFEVWFNAGAQDFPFQPIAGTTLQDGVAACHTLRGLGPSVYWLSESEHGARMVLRSEGYQAVRISTHAIETALNSYSTVQDAVAYLEQWEGHEFYVLTCPTGNATWAYDARTRLWHQRAGYDPMTGQLRRYPAQYHCYAFGQHLVAGDLDTRVYTLDPTYYQHDTEPLIRDRVGWHVKDDASLRLLYWALIEVDCERGVGLDGGVVPGSDPQAMLRWSDDGGQVWSEWRTSAMGPLGEYKRRLLWRRLGRSRDRLVHLRVSDPVNVVLLGARYEAI